MAVWEYGRRHMALTTCIPDRPGGRPERMLVLLHGYGDNEREMALVGRLLDPAARFLIAAPRGPVDVDDRTSAWFEYGPMGPDPDTFGAALVALDETIDELCREHAIGRDQVMIGGFSQGAAMALATALAPGMSRPAGVLALSGFIPDVAGHDHDLAAVAGLDVLMQHGTADQTVPVELGRDSAGLLRSTGATVDFQEYPTGHEPTIDSLADAQRWLEALIPEAGHPGTHSAGTDSAETSPR